MKGFRFFTGGFIFVLIFSALAFAQTENPQTPVALKVALIDTEAFYNKETGIKELVETNDKLELELKPQSDELNILGEKIQKLQKEIEIFQNAAEKFKGICVPDYVNKKFEDYDKLTKEYKQRQDEIKSRYEKSDNEIFADIYKKIGDAIQQFAKEKGYAVILDISKERGTFFLVAKDESSDVTEEFIKYYNNNFAKTKTQ